ncbi:MAG: hypothetical protein Kow0077_27470 [Anaerolineae bacterium]
MLRRKVRWFLLGIVLVALTAAGVAAQGSYAPVPLEDLELSAHEQIAILQIFGDGAVVDPEQLAVRQAAIEIDDTLADRAIEAPPTGFGGLPGIVRLPDAGAVNPAIIVAAENMTAHERAAARAIFGPTGTLVAYPEQLAIAELIAYIDPALLESATLADSFIAPVPAQTSQAPSAVVVESTLTRMTVHEQLALRAVYGDIQFEPSTIQANLAPYANRVGDVERKAADWPPYRASVTTTLNAMTPHEQLAVQAVSGEGFERMAEQEAVALYVHEMALRAIPAWKLEPAYILSTMTAHEQLALRAIYGAGIDHDLPEQRAVAPFVELLSAEVSPELAARLRVIAALNAMTAHEKLALLGIFDTGMNRDLPERAALAPFAAEMGINIASVSQLEAVLATLTVHERLAILALCDSGALTNKRGECAAGTLAALIRAQAR